MALTLNNLVGFETGGLEETKAVAGAPSVQETVVRTGDFSLKLSTAGAAVDIAPFAIVADAGDDQVVGFAVRFSDTTPNTEGFFFAGYEGGNRCWEIRLATDGDLVFQPSVGDPSSVTAPFTDNTWHWIEIRWQHLASGAFDLEVDGNPGLSLTGQDMYVSAAFDAYRLQQWGAVVDVYFDDIYCCSGASGTGDFLGNAEVFRYQADTDSATPDTGDDLDTGVWQNMGTTPGAVAEGVYTVEVATGAVYTDDVASGKHYRHGPHGDANIDGTIKGAKWLHQLRGAGAGDYYKRYGNDGDGLTDAVVTLTTVYANYMTVSELATVVPLATEHFAMGFKIDVRKDLFCKEMWAFILHVPPVGGVVVTPPTATLTISTFAPSILVPVLTTPGTLSLSLATFTPVLGLSVIPPPLALSLTPFAPTITATANVLVTPGTIALSLTAFAPTVSAPRLVTPAAIGLSITTFVPTVTATANVTVTPGVASLLITAFAPTVSTPRLVTPPTATLLLATFAPTISAPRLVTPGVASLSITAFSPTITTTGNVLIIPDIVALSLATFAPTVTATANVTVTPGVCTLSLGLFAPTVTATANVTVIPGVIALSLTTFAPTVTITGDVVVTPGIIVLTLAVFAPVIKLVVTPPTLALNLQTFAPTISTPRLVTPPTATLSLTAFAPTVSAPRLVTPGVVNLSITVFAPTVTATGNVVVIPGVLTLSLGLFAPTVTATANITVTPGVLVLSLTTFAPTVTVRIPGWREPRGGMSPRFGAPPGWRVKEDEELREPEKESTLGRI